MIRIIKKFGLLLNKHQKGRVAIILIMMVLGAFFEVLSISLLVPFVSIVMQPEIISTNKYIGKFVCFFNINSNKELLISGLFILILIFIIKNLYLMLEYYVQYRFIYNNRFRTQSEVMGVYLNKPYEYFLTSNSGEVIRVLNNDICSTYDLLLRLLSVATESIVSITLVVAILIINPLITIATATVLLLTLIVIALIVRPRLKEAGMKRQDALATINKWMLQAVNGIKEIKITGTKGFFQEHFDESGKVAIKAEQNNQIYQDMPRMLIEMVTTCTALTVIGLMALLGTDIAKLIPALSAFVMAAIKLLPSANRIVGGINLIAFKEPSLDQLLEKLRDLRNEKDNEKSEDLGELINKPQNNICFQNVTYKYPTAENNVLENARMDIPIGGMVGIVGSSGAGKTTVVDVLLGLLRVKSGEVLCDGYDISRNYGGWLSHVGYIPQMIFMLDDSIRANVAFGYDPELIDEKKVWAALEKAQLAEFVRTLPDGLDTGIGEKGIRISGGQRQRIGIARAIYSDPEILIFDEATSALDNETESAIMESINALRNEKTMIIIAHRLTTIRGCDIVYRVEKGHIIREKNSEKYRKN